MNNLDVKSIIENELEIKGVEIIKRFAGGMSNFTYLIKIEDALFTYRIPGKNSEVLIDRNVESENLNIVEPLNLNSEIVYLNVENGHKMAKYVEGNNLSEVTDSDYYDQVVEKLKKLHNSNLIAANDYDKLERLSKYEALVDQYGFDRNEKYFELKKSFLELYEKYSDVKFVFCHGDSQQSNWVVSDGLYLLDWEFAGNNDPFYDIACFGNNDFNAAVKLLDVYLGRNATNDELARLYYNRFFQTLQWYNVAVYKELIGLSKELNVDFLYVSEKYINLASGFLVKIKEYTNLK